MFIITKQYSFSCSHQLHGLAADHPCSRMHGHNYIVEIELSAPALNQHGFVRDYRELDDLKIYIHDKIDHRHLNDVFGDDNTTAEKLAQHFYEWCKARWPEVTAARISETPKTWATYRPACAKPELRFGEGRP